MPLGRAYEFPAALTADRCIIVQADYYGGTEYLSNWSFQSAATDTVPSVPYKEYIVGLPVIEMSIDGSSSIGDIEVTNAGGELDNWLSVSWRGWPIKVYFGDPNGVADDFELLADGINGGVSSPAQNTLSFSLKDKKAYLDEPVQTTLMSSGEPTPLCVGTVFNAEPALQDAPTLHYRYHEDSTALATVVRDNGVPVFFADQGDGSFKLVAAPAGRITCDVTGATLGNAWRLVYWLAVRSPYLTAADVDAVQLAAFPATYVSGLYIKEQRTILECIEDVMVSLGGAVIFSRAGLLQMVRLQLPGTPASDVIEDAFIEDGLSILEIEEPRERITLGYQKNWTVQDADSLAGAVTAANRDLYSREYSIVTSDNAGITTEFPLAESPEMVGTSIVSSADAQTEADRRATLRSTKRVRYELDVLTEPFSVMLGDTLTVTHSRFGFDAGVDVLIVGIKEEPTKQRCLLEVWK